MRDLASICCIVALGLVAASRPATAHHSFAAEFDAAKRATLTGTVTKIEWTNPHVFFYIDVAGEQGAEAANWQAEMNSPNSLMRLGWTRESMKVGDVVTVQGSLARNGSRLINAQFVVMASTGQRLFAGSSDGSPTQ